MKKIIFSLTLIISVCLAFTNALAGKLGLVDNAQDNLPIANATSYSIRSLHDFHFEKSVMNKLYKTYGNGFNTLDILRSLDRWEMVSNETMTAEEEGYDIRTITMGTVSVAASPGDPATFTLDADDLDAAYHYYPRENFTVQLGSVVDGFIQARITGIAGTGTSTVTITIKPYDVTKTLNATFLATGKEVAILDSAYAVETGQPVGTSVGYFERTFYAQILKETLTFGGMELAKQKWVEVEGIGFYNKELNRTEFNLDRQEESALLMGQVNTNAITQTSSVSATAVPVYKNKGVWTWIDELGGDLTYAGATGPTVSQFDDAAEYFESQGITSGVVMYGMGTSLMRRYENAGVTYYTNPGGAATQGGGLTSDFIRKEMGIGGGEPSMTLEIGFKAMQKGGLMFMFHPIPQFSNPFQLGISNYMLNDAGMMYPVSMVRDRVSGGMIPNLSAKYVGINGYSRKRVVAGLGGMDGFMKQQFNFPIISSIDANNTYWLSHVMFPFMEANKAMLVKRSS